ncbi:dihydrolipoamide acetyltransferase component of pyruvate dehydrogenase complex [Pilimelia anulata]|uniref:Dihydrolipoamide acetyltransferase component of pyruvate dehydrogenase complex n=1 Tax=Pilimelia anulata TaxID=53371 RepID=A0A8J3B1C3_9ACTN|nr:2-oxoglutarate dehydrogenase, E2 component, dihydrolipoamide succinyltransferase [Pilimelia anulata]GGJ84757.1 dihydrolipoamide acetyltransferase component of pyruvate dehydrogenase complex [Pilimelia anulata]
MPVSVTMPRLGESVTEGTVTRWLKAEGERVEVDEPLLEVSTDKVDTEIPSPAAGVLARIVVGEDETADVGSELAVISDAAGDAAPAAAPAAPAAAPAPEPAPAAAAAPAPAPAAAPAAAGAGGSAAGTPVAMPALGESVTEGTVTRWLKQVGESVAMDEPLLEVSTDKVDTEIPSPVAGTLLEIRVAEDETADVGAVLAVVGSGAAAPAAAPAETPAPPAPAASAPQPAAPAQPAIGRATPPPPPPGKGAAPGTGTPAGVESAPAPRVSGDAAEAAPAGAGRAASNGGGGYVTPLVRKLAAEQGVDLGAVTGTGVGGRIRRQDVLDAAARVEAAPAAAPAAPPAGAPAAPAKATPSPLRGRTEKLSRMRALIARRMVESLQVSAQLTTVVEVDVTRIAKLRQRAKDAFQQRHGAKLSFLPFFAVAAVEALRVHPNVNASLDMEAGTVTYHAAEHLGMAVDTERGLLVPVIHDAGDLNLAGLAKRIADVADRTRTNKISPDELSGGTFTLTNTGSRGALFDTPIINQPQVAILGTGAVVKRAVVVADPELGEIVAPRSMVYLALSYDHRIVDGADAARFLTTVKERLEAAQFEGELGLA